MKDSLKEARKILQAEARRLGGKLEKETSRKRGPLVRRMHEVRSMLAPGYAYTSQAGQDFVVDRVMKGKREGTFVDVGAYDGVTGSNTFFLETHRGWTGALVEPVPSQRAKADVMRRAPSLGVAVAAEEGEADFIEITEGYTQMSGLAATYDKNLLTTVRKDKRHKETTHKVQTKTLSGILHEAGIVNPDFLSLDIEGGELACLKTFPFADHDIAIWAIENNTGTPEIKKIMDDNGYDLIEFCGPDEMYFKRSP
ncbi:FkbM family methyltransferase [Pseudooctadecabacter jejudonensis]|uniref:Methyltransferase FkbM domain-containing protein n=1 Tax=Pseudooctadecabacter jejudonensis TaxID=1391910 RepID=A0A1Y5S4W8_9RHOB|nr:FkbM family methyltransferase [Pseudooctadecabacter jejudonensis]SLN32222.1 hypothetical protein PSJ8397_01510 [Pseudooctadecabacter jejudonensis]